MDFTFHLTNLTYWQKTCQSASIAFKADASLALDTRGWPKLPWVSAMQRRRLSPFMKMALHCAYQTSDGYPQPLATVFSSRHGDLTQTSALLETLAEKAPLSPTAFSLSVHNAVAGLFSILSASTMPSTTVVAGANTLPMAIAEGIAKAHRDQSSVMVVHVDQALPPLFEGFQDEQQISHALAFIIEPKKKANIRLTQKPSPQSPDGGLPLSVVFAQDISKSQNAVNHAQGWQWKYTPC
ncbi:beta-ketoacyl synthase chain length factor [Alteromonas sp. 14N.309.X.WAT.G.H12]|uniref:beta-ketoacyl synthase chain length factor n=1 Tax=Alteromonas sp. 14N.309.X.WAT.G.H12 TaxID=3120824 RepID=UPI002FD1C82C